jgi:hypothetical protein
VSARGQKMFFLDASPRLGHVVAFSRHRYDWMSGEAPADVSWHLLRREGVSVSVDVSPTEARALAQALLEAADAAEAMEPTGEAPPTPEAA